MKKMFALTIIMFIASAGLAMADISEIASSDIDFTNGKSALITEGAADSGNNISKLSTGVALGWATTTSGYAIVSAHADGSKTLGTAHDSTALYANSDKPLDAPGSADVSGVNIAGFSAL